MKNFFKTILFIILIKLIIVLVGCSDNSVGIETSVEPTPVVESVEDSVEPVEVRNIAFFGNSLLMGSGLYGLGASDDEHDYAGLIGKTFNCGVNRMASLMFELETKEEAVSTIETWKSVISDSDLDYVILQIGDNVATGDHSEFDSNLMKIIEETHNSTDAEIILVGLWYDWNNGVKSFMSGIEGTTFVDISECHTVENEMGYETNDWVALKQAEGTHPNNSGYACIAEKIINIIR